VVRLLIFRSASFDGRPFPSPTISPQARESRSRSLFPFLGSYKLWTVLAFSYLASQRPVLLPPGSRLLRRDPFLPYFVERCPPPSCEHVSFLCAWSCPIRIDSPGVAFFLRLRSLKAFLALSPRALPFSGAPPRVQGSYLTRSGVSAIRPLVPFPPFVVLANRAQWYHCLFFLAPSSFSRPPRCMK